MANVRVWPLAGTKALVSRVEELLTSEENSENSVELMPVAVNLPVKR